MAEYLEQPGARKFALAPCGRGHVGYFVNEEGVRGRSVTSSPLRSCPSPLHFCLSTVHAPPARGEGNVTTITVDQLHGLGQATRRIRRGRYAVLLPRGERCRCAQLRSIRMQYVDGFVVPVPKKQLPAYRSMA